MINLYVFAVVKFLPSLRNSQLKCIQTPCVASMSAPKLKQSKDISVLVAPCREHNAIKVVAFALELSKPVSVEAVKRLLNHYHKDSELRQFFPRHQLHEAVTIELNQLEGQQTTPVKSIGGITFDCLTRSGEQEWAFSANNQTIIVRCTVYSCWSDIKPKALEILEKLMPYIDENGMGVSVVGLEYLDEFLIKSVEDNKWKKDLFNLESVYIPRNAINLNGFWHSHHGFMNEVEGPLKHRELNNVNIEFILNDQNEYKAVIKTQHKMILDEPSPIEELFSDRSLSSLIESSHVLNKSIFSDLLSEEVKTIIGLEA